MIESASTYTDLSKIRRGAARSGAPAVISKRVRAYARHREWLLKELRAGGYFDRYVQRERGKLSRSIQLTARGFHDARPKSWRSLSREAREAEVELKYVIPPRLYFRLRQMDPYFFDDPANLRRLKADNPDLCIWN